MAEIENLQIVGGAIYTVGNQDIIADDWEAGKTYIKDRSYAIKDHKLYQCAVSHTSVEPFDPTKWTEKTVAEALGTAGSANMIECTLAEYNAWKAGGQLINETVYVITDAPNLNETAKQISYAGGTDSTYDVIEEVKDDIGDLSDLTTTDKSSLVAAINELIATSKLNPVYGNTASGAIATFDTSLALPLQDCTIAINAVQESGTPTPSSPKAISGFTACNIVKNGANQWDEQWDNGDISDTTGAKVSGTRIVSKNYISCLPSTSYCFIKLNSTSMTDIKPYFYDADKNFIIAGDWSRGHEVQTVPSNCYYMLFKSANGYGSTYNNDISINYPATDTDYHAYNGETKQISFGSAGTVYGGSLDVTSGVLVVTQARVDLGSLTQWNKNTSFTNTLFVTNVSGKKTNNSNCLCTNYVNGGIATGGTFLNNMQNNNFASDISNGIYIRDDSKASLSGDDFKTAMSGVYLVYELATPQTYQLTPTQISAIVGTNNVFTDTNGNTSVVYACSLKDYIDSQ